MRRTGNKSRWRLAFDFQPFPFAPFVSSGFTYLYLYIYIRDFVYFSHSSVEFFFIFSHEFPPASFGGDTPAAPKILTTSDLIFFLCFFVMAFLFLIPELSTLAEWSGAEPLEVALFKQHEMPSSSSHLNLVQSCGKILPTMSAWIKLIAPKFP